MNNYYKYCWLSIGLLIATTARAIALPQNQSISVNTSTIIAREYTFKAPDRKFLTNTEQLKAAPGYKVEVYGADRELLLRVRNIEPKAFAKEDTIQVGIFKRQKNAEDLVRKLTIEGLWARILPL